MNVCVKDTLNRPVIMVNISAYLKRAPTGNASFGSKPSTKTKHQAIRLTTKRKITPETMSNITTKSKYF